LWATGETLAEIARMVHRPGSQLQGKAAIAKRTGRKANRWKVEKHFDITMTDDHLSWSSKEDRIAREAQHDGIHVVRTSLPPGDDNPEEAKAKRGSPVSPAVVSNEVLTKSRKKVSPDGLPVHSITTLLADLATHTLNEVVLPSHRDHSFVTTPQPTGVQARAFELLEIRIERGVAMQSDRLKSGKEGQYPPLQLGQWRNYMLLWLRKFSLMK